jgi:hypothetical protein
MIQKRIYQIFFFVFPIQTYALSVEMLFNMTLFSLIILLIIVISVSYHRNKEGFENITSRVNTSSLTETEASNGTATETDVLKETATRTDVSKETATAKGAVVGAITGSVPQNNLVKGENSISQTDADALKLQDKMKLLKDIQDIVRNELLVARNTELMIPDTNGGQGSNGIQQGKEYENNCYKEKNECPKKESCSSKPNMANYIKKDQIPCWGCNLDY